MTRYPPQGGYPGGDDQYGYRQQGGQSYYGSYSPGEGQGHSTAPDYQSPQYSEPNPGAAQSYYGSNDQPYQQYPNQRSSGYQDQPGYGAQAPYGVQQYPPHGPPGGTSHPAPHMQQHQYGQYPPSQDYPPFGQEQQHASQYGYGPLGGSDVNAFKAHYEQPHGPIDSATTQPLPPGAEGDRGIMGALTGGAAGAFGGHKMGHGFLGGVGGAVAGSMLEDAYKKHNKKDKKEKKPKSRRGSHSSSSSSSSDSSDDEKKHHRRSGHGGYAGNFSASSRDVRLEGRCTLVAECCNANGHHHRSHIDLNDCLTNQDGHLQWARGGNFAASAREIHLVDGGKGLEAELGDGRGGWRWNMMRLDERITNNDGRLEML